MSVTKADVNTVNAAMRVISKAFDVLLKPEAHTREEKDVAFEVIGIYMRLRETR